MFKQNEFDDWLLIKIWTLARIINVLVHKVNNINGKDNISINIKLFIIHKDKEVLGI
jgi:plasmid maintenance system antidote protein VapI